MYKLNLIKGFKCMCACVLCGVHLFTCLASIDSSSSVTVALPTHIEGCGIRVFQSEKSTGTQLTVLA